MYRGESDAGEWWIKSTAYFVSGANTGIKGRETNVVRRLCRLKRKKKGTCRRTLYEDSEGGKDDVEEDEALLPSLR